MSGGVVRCGRCRRRMRGLGGGWNADFIAGLIVGYICPDCQTPQEDLDAELNLITGASDMVPLRADRYEPEAYITHVINGLVRTYPTPEMLRDKANQLGDRRRDQQASQMVGLMRNVADDMESGELWANA